MNISNKIKNWNSKTNESEVRIDLISELSKFLTNGSFSSKDCKEIRLALTELNTSEEESKFCYLYFRNLFRCMEVDLRHKEREKKISILFKEPICLNVLDHLYNNYHTPLTTNDLLVEFNIDKNKLENFISEMEDIGFIERYTEGFLIKEFGCQTLMSFKNV